MSPVFPSSTNGDNTYILDPESAAEMTRLIKLGQITTKGMGGALAGLPTLPEGAKVLDIACGPGGWALDLAFHHPDMQVIGIDISQTMITYANTQAIARGLHNISFEVMDATKPLEFSDRYFDLINGRLMGSFLPRDNWPRLLQECRRILRPGGILRITETDSGGITTSPAFDQLNIFLFRSMHQLGYGFSLTGVTLGLTPMLEHLFRQAGYSQLQSQAHAINFSSDAEAWSDFYHNAEIVFNGALPLLQKMNMSTQEELFVLQQNMLIEMYKSDFHGMWYLLSVWGENQADQS
jgi:ubiquinone/menaquinone biosynthesis C-methylase UbiE